MSIFVDPLKPNFTIYTNAFIYVNGSLLTEETSVTVNRVANSRSYNTIGKGYAGEGLGSPTIQLTVSNAVPSIGFELDPGRFMLFNQKVEFLVVSGDTALGFSGFIVSDNFTHAVNTNANLTFTANCFYSVNWD